MSVQAPIHQNRQAYAPRSRPNPEARITRAYTLIAEPYAQLVERLRTAGMLQPVEVKLPDPIPRNFDGNKYELLFLTNNFHVMFLVYLFMLGFILFGLEQLRRWLSIVVHLNIPLNIGFIITI